MQIFQEKYTFTDCHFFVAKWRIFLIRVYFARELYSTLQGQFKYTFLGIFAYFKATLKMQYTYAKYKKICPKARFSTYKILYNTCNVAKTVREIQYF